MNTKNIQISATELAFIISNNENAQGSQCRIDCRPDDGRLYFAQPGEEQGDDFTIFEFYPCDMDLTFGSGLIVWVKDSIELPQGFEFV